MNVTAALEHGPEWHAERRKGIGGSDAPKIMKGEWGLLYDQKTGASEGDDLSNILPVQMGSWTEPLNVYWFEKQTGLHVTTARRLCDHLVHPKHKFMRANLDGAVGGTGQKCIFEAKHVSAFAKDGEIVDRYYPQLQHCMAVAGADKAYLSVFFGNFKWAMFEISANKGYQEQLIAREAEFWGHVERGDRPGEAEDKSITIPLDDMREVSMTGNNAWASGAADWLENQSGAKVFKVAEKELKELVEADVKLATGHGIKIARSKNGAMRIGVQK